jgi:hypothetical protein
MKTKVFIRSEIKTFMKTRIINRLATLCALSVCLGTGFVRLASGQQACCLSLPAPPNNAIAVNLTAFQSPDHFLDVQVVSAPAGISPGQYPGWCVEERVDIPVTGTTVPVGYIGQVFSSCDPNINKYLVAEPDALNGNWQAVNYILNHRAGYSYSDVQAAIWYFVGSGQPPVPLPYPGGPSGVPYPFVPNQVNVDLLVADASANTAAWIGAGHPRCGDVTAAVLLFDGLPNPPGTPDLQLLLIEVPCTCPLSRGDTATIGFWHNKNGQTLINSFNSGPTSTKLGTWLASNFGCLFGNLNGQPNFVVAAQFLTYFNVKGQKTYAQILAGALACYATSSTLAGGNMAAGYGFNVSSTGTGAKTYNVGSNGTAIGLLNNTFYTVAQLLQAANANCSKGTIAPGAFNALNNIFDGINSSGDIN